jgi:hypothetical protein
VTAGVDEIYLKRLENTRNDSAKKSRKKNGQSKQQNLVADFHNDS